MTETISRTDIWVRPDNPLPFAQPDIDQTDIDGVVETLRSRWITTGPRVREFEAKFAEYVGVKHAIALNSATAALHLALDAAGVQRGDEVIVPTYTFTASAEVVRYFDAKPVLVDVEADTLCIDPRSFEAAITQRTRAVIPVHLGGHSAAMNEIREIAARHGIIVIEDAAHSFPAWYDGRLCGTMGHMGVFSFYATKTITTAEGGMLVTDDDEYADRARVMSLHGMSKDAWKRYAAGGSWRYDVVAPGYKYNMTDLAASLGVTQLVRAESMWRRRVEIAECFSAAFSGLHGIQLPETRSGVVHAWHLYLIRVDEAASGLSRDTFIEQLGQHGISTSVHFIPVHSFTYYATEYGWQDADFPVASREWRRAISLPIYPVMSDQDVEDVIQAVTRTVNPRR